MILSKSCTYGILASIFVAARTTVTSPDDEHSKSNFVPISLIAEHLNLSFHFLTKVLQILTLNNIMMSYRGPNGGVALARPAEEITLRDIIIAIDGGDIFTSCLLGLPGCGRATPCPAHENWGTLRKNIEDICRLSTLAELTKNTNDLHYRLRLETETPVTILETATTLVQKRENTEHNF